MSEQNCDCIKVTYTLVGEEPVTVEVESSGIDGDNYNYYENELFLIYFGGNDWRVDTGSSIDVLPLDTPCPFGTYVLEDGGSIFESFSVEPCEPSGECCDEYIDLTLNAEIFGGEILVRLDKINETTWRGNYEAYDIGIEYFPPMSGGPLWILYIDGVEVADIEGEGCPFGEWRILEYLTSITASGNSCGESPGGGCDCISVTYKLIGEEPVTVEVGSIGEANGKLYYYFNIIKNEGTEEEQGWNMELAWNPDFNSWYIYNNIDSIDYLSEDTPCPFGTFTIEEGSIFESFVVEPCTIPNPYDESINCYKLLVWKKQCEFSKCVLKYLRNLQFGIFNCNELEHLKNKRRVLNILNRYDARDILNNTTEYNTITYAEIQALLNY